MSDHKEIFTLEQAIRVTHEIIARMKPGEDASAIHALIRYAKTNAESRDERG